MTTIACIFARGGSKGVHRKNLRRVGGIPLLGHAIRHAQAATLVDRVMVSTEDAEIVDVALQYGAGIIPRPVELAADDSPEWLAWQHAVRYLATEPGRADKWGWTFVSVPCTAPLRVPADVDAVIERLRMGDCDAVMTVTEARRNPYFNMVRERPDGTVRPVMISPACRRQDCPTLYDCTTVAYAARPEYVMEAPQLLAGNVVKVVIPPERALDIDIEWDLRIADLLVRGAQLQGALDHWLKAGRDALTPEEEDVLFPAINAEGERENNG